MFYKMVIAYDGTNFCGWAPQPNQNSVSQFMQKKFQEIFGHTITITGASRTDAGVHALGQVARFQTDIAINTHGLRKAWNARLGDTVFIRSLEAIPTPFNPRTNVSHKTYYYHFFLDRPLPFIAKYGLYHPKKLDLALLEHVLQLFVGTHNFTSFSTGEPIAGNPICTIKSIKLHYFKRFGMYQISVTGNRFLRHMIRRLVGAALLTAKQGSPVTINQVHDALKGENSSHCLPTAPAHGLLLYKIYYKQI
jgi:tRNA pseudouridine38-40 synthase